MRFGGWRWGEVSLIHSRNQEKWTRENQKAKRGLWNWIQKVLGFVLKISQQLQDVWNNEKVAGSDD